MSVCLLNDPYPTGLESGLTPFSNAAKTWRLESEANRK